ncbi:hypothetical protein [Streptomyces sp. NPDC057686]|uniref:hypothetical protein n=1 Tax=Streptomyces sp. NPDC057686 TaxID=3346212 RepID=UPI00368CE078
MDGKDGQDEVAPPEHAAALTSLRRRQVGALALSRLRAPLFAFDMDAEWGIDLAVLESLFQAAVSAPGGDSDRRYCQALDELHGAPLFTSEVDCPNVRELIQLETIAGLLTFGEALKEPGTDKIDRIVDLPRGLADYLDQHVENSLHSHPSEETHRQYLAKLAEPVRSAGLGYLGSRNRVIENACDNALQALPPSGGLLDTAVGRDLITRCENFGTELAAIVRWIDTTGY